MMKLSILNDDGVCQKCAKDLGEEEFEKDI